MIYQIIGLFLLITSSTHLVDRIASFDTDVVRSLQNTFHKRPWLPLYQDIWSFGRTSFAVVTLLLFTAAYWKKGGVAFSVFLTIIGIEQIIKLIFKRSRPFNTHQDIRMLQPIEPHDPSFPSGDALRIWYLTLIIPAAFSGPSILLIAGIILAILVSLGRTVMGVHYPSDVTAGMGLGFIGAGTTIWLWFLLGLN
jgi:undecaprenyl-diphosphatase